MLEDCGRLYDLESNHNDFSKRLSLLSLPTGGGSPSTPLHVSKQLHKIHILNHHIGKARSCAAKFRLFWKTCGRSSKTDGTGGTGGTGGTNGSAASWESKVEFEGRHDSYKSFFTSFINEYKHHEKEINELRKEIDPKIVNELQSLNRNLDFLNRNM